MFHTFSFTLAYIYIYEFMCMNVRGETVFWEKWKERSYQYVFQESIYSHFQKAGNLKSENIGNIFAML